MVRMKNVLVRRLICTIVAFLMSASVFVMTGCSGAFSAAEDAAKRAEMAVVENQPDAYMECLCPAYVKYMMDSWGYTEEELTDELGDYNYEEVGGSFESDCGTGFSADYEVSDTESFDSSDYSKIVKDLVNHYEYDKGSIQDLKRVEVTTSAKGSEGTATWSGRYSCVKYDGAWYVHRPGFDV